MPGFISGTVAPWVPMPNVGPPYAQPADMRQHLWPDLTAAAFDLLTCLFTVDG